MFVFAVGFFILKKGFAALAQVMSVLQPEKRVPTAEPRRCRGRLWCPASTAWSPRCPGEGTAMQQPETLVEKSYFLIEGLCSCCQEQMPLGSCSAKIPQALPIPQLPVVGGPTCTEDLIFELKCPQSWAIVALMSSLERRKEFADKFRGATNLATP